MTTSTPQRPTQATVSGWLIVGGSIAVIVLCFDQVSRLGTLESQESLREVLSQPPGSGLGIDAGALADLLRILATVAAGAAAATAILGWHALRRSTSARLALSVLAPVLLLAGISTSGFVSTLVALAVVMLWVQPTRAWFAGGTPPEAPTRATMSAMSSSYPGPSEPSQPNQNPYGSSYPPPPDTSASPYGGGSAYGSPSPYGSGAPTSRPGALTAAAIITLVASIITALGAGIFGLIFLVAGGPDFEREVEQALADQNYDISVDDFSAFMNVLGVVFLVIALWSVIAAVLAVLTMRGSNGARIALIVSAAVASLLALISILSLISAIWLIACIVVIVLLVRGEVTAYCKRPRA